MADDGLGQPAGEDDTDLDQAMSGGQSQTAGRFRYYIDDERWEWSDEVQQLHGYEPGELPSPSTEQVLSHKHVDDRDHVVGALDDTRRTRAAFSTRHRMIDRAGREHRVVVVGDQLRDDDGTVIGTHGFYIDVTPAEAAFEGRITDAVTDVVERRAAIEQAKGMLMLIYGFSDAAAFNVMRSLSQDSNIKLKVIAEQIVADFVDAARSEPFSRSPFDRLLVTTAERARSR